MSWGASPWLSERTRRLAASIMVVAVLGLHPANGTAAGSRPLEGPGTTFTWIVDPNTIQVNPPPGRAKTRRELDQVRRLERNRSKRQRRIAVRWERAATLPWTRTILEMIRVHRPAAFATRSARALGLLHLGMYDALALAIEARGRFDRERPYQRAKDLEPLFRARGAAYPDIVSAISGAAEVILPYLFPGEPPRTFTRLATRAGRSRLWAGVSLASDVAAGRALGRLVGTQVVAYGQNDGHATSASTIMSGRLCEPADCNDPEQENWVPTPPSYQFPPSDPSASWWNTYLLESPDQFLPPPPPAYGSPSFMNMLFELKVANDGADAGTRELGLFWDDGPGTHSPAGHWNQIAADIAQNRRVGTVKTARMFALMNASTVDAFIASWNAKYTYWSIRPVTVIRERPEILGSPNPLYDPQWLPNITTPPFPAYPSGHATESAAAARVLQFFLGRNADGLSQEVGAVGAFDEIADEVALSRMIGGIHIRVDNDEALILGRRIAGVALELATSLGWRPFAQRGRQRMPRSAVP